MDQKNPGTKFGRMNGWLDIDDKKKKLAYEQVAAKENLSPIAIEKDYWVTLVLQSVFEPQEERSLTIGSFGVFPNYDLESSPARVPCVLPKRTFLEKVFLLHEEFQKTRTRCERKD